MHILREYLFLIPLVVALLSELAKIATEYARTGAWHEKLFHPGGMPSTHSAFVTSLLIVVWRKLGLESTEFAIAFVFACLIWYDAMSSRRSIGEQAAVLNTLQHKKHFREKLGHSFLEVIGGIVFGFVVTWVGILVS